MKKRIEDLIERKRMNEGASGIEITSVTIELTDEEREEFYNIDLEEGYYYELDGNELTITYSEE